MFDSWIHLRRRWAIPATFLLALSLTGQDSCPVEPCDDLDGDSVCDTEDVCPGFDDYLDMDFDGIPDGCDPCPESAENQDSDEDGICDYEDVCPEGDNADADGDGVCDYEDPCLEGDNTDADGDGVCDYEDPCLDGDNTDADGDGVCDYEDPCLEGDNTDADGDGVCDYEDPCPDDATNLCDSCPPELDVAQLFTDNTASFNGDYVGNSFTVGVDGLLTDLALQFSTAHQGTLEIYRGGISGVDTTGPLIQSQAISFGASDDPQVFTLDTPILVTAGEVLTWKVQSDTWLNANICSSDCYSGGRSLATGSYDHIFEAYIAPSSCCEEGSIVDQSNTTVTTSAGINGDYFGQSFTAGVDGILSGISLQVSTAGQGTLQIYQGGISGISTTGPLLTEQTISFGASNDLQSFTLETGIEITAGESYTWKLQSSEWLSANICDNGCYSGGQALAYSGYDQQFETLVETCQ